MREVHIIVTKDKTGDLYNMKSYPTEVQGYRFEIPVHNIIVKGTTAEGKSKKRLFKCLRFCAYYNNPKDPDHRYKTLGGPFIAGLADAHVYTCSYYNRAYEVHNRHSPYGGAFRITGSHLVHAGPASLSDTEPPWGSAGCVEVIGNFETFKNYVHDLSGANLPRDEGLHDLVQMRKLHIEIEHDIKPPVKRIRVT